MAEYDAFGRKKGEDTLAEMGWTSGATPVERPTTTPRAEARQAAADEARHAAAGQAAPSADEERRAVQADESVLAAGTAASVSEALRAARAASKASPRPRTRRRAGALRTLILVAVLGAGGASLFNQSDTAKRVQDAISTVVTDINVETQTTDDAEAEQPASGGSLLRAAALRDALAKLPDGELSLLRVAPDRINATVFADGKLHMVRVSADGDVQDVATNSSTPPAGVLRVNPAAPYRIARTAARRAGRKVSSVSYLVLVDMGGKSEWSLFFDDGLHFRGSGDGRTVRRV